MASVVVAMSDVTWASLLTGCLGFYLMTCQSQLFPWRALPVIIIPAASIVYTLGHTWAALLVVGIVTDAVTIMWVDADCCITFCTRLLAVIPVTPLCSHTHQNMQHYQRLLPNTKHIGLLCWSFENVYFLSATINDANAREARLNKPTTKLYFHSFVQKSRSLQLGRLANGPKRSASNKRACGMF